jgi:hypothetical protein
MGVSTIPTPNAAGPVIRSRAYTGAGYLYWLSCRRCHAVGDETANRRAVEAEAAAHVCEDRPAEADIEYALMIDWGQDGIEYVRAKSVEHAERMAESIYAGTTCWTVGRERHPWRFVRRADVCLTDNVVAR